MSPVCKGVKGTWGSGAGKLLLTNFQRALQNSASRGECRKLGMWGGSVGSPGESMGLCTSPQRGSAFEPRGFLGKAHTLRRTISKSLVQSRYTLRVSLVKVSLIILLIFSAFPEDWGWYGMWNFQGICKNWTSCWVTLDVNYRSLSGCRDEGSTSLGIISVRRIWATVWALLFVVGNVSTHPRKVATRTRRYLNLRTGAYE